MVNNCAVQFLSWNLRILLFYTHFIHEMRLFSDFDKIYWGLHIIFTKKFFFSLANVSDLSNKSALYCSGGKWGVFTTWWHLDGGQIIKLIISIFPALPESEIWPGHDKHGTTALQLQLVISSIHTGCCCLLTAKAAPFTRKLQKMSKYIPVK